MLDSLSYSSDLNAAVSSSFGVTGNKNSAPTDNLSLSPPPCLADPLIKIGTPGVPRSEATLLGSGLSK